jgi:ABC-2 type transport system permease protein
MPLYFSRPLRRFDYFAGKLGVIAFFLAIVAIVPAVLAWLLGLAFSLDITVFRDTNRLLVGSVIYGAVIVLSAGTLMLAISSLTRRSLYVGLIWIGMWLVSGTIAGILILLTQKPWLAIVSYDANLTRTGAALLNTRAAWETFGKFMVTETPSEPYSSSDGRHSRHRPPIPRPSAEEIAEQREEMVSQLSGTAYPWYYSGAVLAGLFGLSICILTTRVKSMDRLK